MNYIQEAGQTKSDKFYGSGVSYSYFLNLIAHIASRVDELDLVKKALFYGKPHPSVTSLNEPTCTVLIGKLTTSSEVDIDLLHGIIGKVTESGELLEALLKSFNFGSQLDLVNLVEELGDGQWYDAIMAKALGVTFEEIQHRNIAKLRARFPDKFTEHDANNRDLGAERQILENKELTHVLYSTTDAQIWAQKFIDICNGFDSNWQERIDESFMLGWFANAIENAKTHERREMQTEINDLKKQLSLLEHQTDTGVYGR